MRAARPDKPVSGYLPVPKLRAGPDERPARSGLEQLLRSRARLKICHGATEPQRKERGGQGEGGTRRRGVFLLVSLSPCLLVFLSFSLCPSFSLSLWRGRTNCI